MFSLRATLSGRAGTKLRQEDKLRREDNTLAARSFRSPKANIIVFRALTEKPSELKLVKISGQIKELILQSIHSE